MSVNTLASTKLDEAKENLNESYKCLLVFMDEVNNTDEYPESFVDEVHDVASGILRFKRRL